jgi:DNA primase
VVHILIVNGIPILIPIYNILIDLRRELQLAGIDLLHEVKAPRYTGQDVTVTCIFHKNGQEKKPSAGITTCDKQYNGRTLKTGTYSCFTCKKTVDFDEFISNCFGHINDMGTYGAKWLIERYGEFELEDRKELFPTLTRDTHKKVEEANEYIPEERLDRYAYIHPYMYKRYLTDDLINFYDIGYEKECKLSEELKPFEAITFPVRDIEGQVIFVAKRSINSKLFVLPNNLEKPIYGIYEVNKLFPNAKEVYITESVFNCLTLINYGIPAICIFGTGSHEQYSVLKSLSYRKYILALDSDNAGYKGIKRLIEALKNAKLLEWISLPKGKDINDLGYLTKEEFFDRIEFHSISDIDDYIIKEEKQNEIIY